jgi:hypothetical protein
MKIGGNAKRIWSEPLLDMLGVVASEGNLPLVQAVIYLVSDPRLEVYQLKCYQNALFVAVQCATKNGHTGVVRYRLQKEPGFASYAILEATDKGHLDLVMQLLVAKGADAFRSVPTTQLTAFSMAVRLTYEEESMQLLRVIFASDHLSQHPAKDHSREIFQALQRCIGSARADTIEQFLCAPIIHEVILEVARKTATKQDALISALSSHVWKAHPQQALRILKLLMR